MTEPGLLLAGPALVISDFVMSGNGYGHYHGHNSIWSH